MSSSNLKALQKTAPRNVPDTPEHNKTSEKNGAKRTNGTQGKVNVVQQLKSWAIKATESKSARTDRKDILAAKKIDQHLTQALDAVKGPSKGAFLREITAIAVTLEAVVARHPAMKKGTTERVDDKTQTNRAFGLHLNKVIPTLKEAELRDLGKRLAAVEDGSTVAGNRLIQQLRDAVTDKLSRLATGDVADPATALAAVVDDNSSLEELASLGDTASVGDAASVGRSEGEDAIDVAQRQLEATDLADILDSDVEGLKKTLDHITLVVPVTARPENLVVLRMMAAAVDKAARQLDQKFSAEAATQVDMSKSIAIANAAEATWLASDAQHAIEQIDATVMDALLNMDPGSIRSMSLKALKPLKNVIGFYNERAKSSPEIEHPLWPLTDAIRTAELKFSRELVGEIGLSTFHARELKDAALEKLQKKLNDLPYTPDALRTIAADVRSEITRRQNPDAEATASTEKPIKTPAASLRMLTRRLDTAAASLATATVSRQELRKLKTKVEGIVSQVTRLESGFQIEVTAATAVRNLPGARLDKRKPPEVVQKNLDVARKALADAKALNVQIDKAMTRASDIALAQRALQTIRTQGIQLTSITQTWELLGQFSLIAEVTSKEDELRDLEEQMSGISKVLGGAKVDEENAGEMRELQDQLDIVLKAVQTKIALS